MSSNGDHWFVAYTQPLREKYAAEWVAKQSFEYYLPRCETTVVRAGRRTAQTKPLFPNYLFVRTGTGQWRVLLSTFGIRGVVLRGTDTPAHLKNEIIENIRGREDRAGIITLPKLEPFQPKDSVVITKGAFAGKVGLYEGQTDQERQKVLLEFMGGKIPVLFHKDELRAA